MTSSSACYKHATSSPGAAQGLEIDGAKYFQAREIFANFSHSQKKWCNVQKIGVTFAPSVPPYPAPTNLLKTSSLTLAIAQKT